MLFGTNNISFYQKQAMMILFAAAIACGCQDTIVVVIQPYVQISLQSNIFVSQFLLAQYGIGHTIGTIVSSSIYDKLGRVRGLIYVGVGQALSGMMYASTQTTEMLSLSHIFDGFFVGVFYTGLLILAYEMMHVKRNQAVVIIFIGQAIGQLVAVLIGQFVMMTLNGSWGLCVSFSSFFVLIILPVIYLFVKDSPLYYMAKEDNSGMHQLLTHINNMENNDLWYVPHTNRRVGDNTTNGSNALHGAEPFDQATVGKFWINVPQIFAFPFTGSLIYLWSIHQQNKQADDIYLYQKVSYYFYALNLPFATDFVWHLMSLGVAFYLVNKGRKFVLIVMFAISSIMLMYYMTLAYANQQVYNITSSNQYPNGSGSSQPQYPYPGNNNIYTGFPYYYFPYIQTGYPNYQLVWFDWTMFGLRIIEPALTVITLESYPTRLRVTALGLMLTFQSLSKVLVRLTQALMFNLSSIFFYSVMAFLMVLGSIVATLMKSTEVDEFDGFHQDNNQDMEMNDVRQQQYRQTEQDDSQKQSQLMTPLVPQRPRYMMDPNESSSSVELQAPQRLDPNILKRIRELNEKYLQP